MIKYIILSFLAVQSLIAQPTKLILSAGALSNAGVYDAFYSSHIFSGDEQKPFFISNAHVKIYAAHGAIFYSESALDPELIVKALAFTPPKESLSPALLAQSYGAVALGESALTNQSVMHYLAATPTSFRRETRVLATGEEIIAFTFEQQAIRWPTQAKELSLLPAVVIETSAGEKMLVAARALGGHDRIMHMVEEAQKRLGPQALYLDLGSDMAPDSALVQALIRRKPDAFLLGTGGIGALSLGSQALGGLSLVYPYGDSSSKEFPGLKISSLAGQEKLWPLFSNLGALQKLKAIKTQAHKVNIIRVFSEAAALEAAKNRHVDLVLLAVDHKFSQLAMREIIEAKKGDLAPILRISALDISEVLISKNNNIRRVEIRRYEVENKNFVGGYEKPDNFLKALPSLAELLKKPQALWQSKDFDSVLAGMMLKHSKADVAIFESTKNTTPISGAVSNNIARAYFERPGIITSVVVSGKQLKKLGALIQKKALGDGLVIFGFDPKSRQVRERALNDAQKYKITLSEEALLEIFGVAMLGGLSEEYAQRAIFAEQIAARLTSLFFLAGPKMLTIADSAESVQAALTNLKAHESFNSMLISELATLNESEIISFINYPAGRARHSLTLGIDYLDIGFSTMTRNAVYDKYFSDKSLANITRAGVTPDAHVFLFSRLSLVYDAPMLETTLSNNTAYLQTSQLGEPERDKTVFGLDFRLPWERSLFKDKKVVLSPVLRNAYQTQIAPNGILPRREALKGEHEKELKSKKRKQRLDSLLGANFNFTDLGFNFDLGAVMAVDMLKKSAREAFDFGPGINFSGKWSLYGPLELTYVAKASYLFGLPKSSAPDKAALAIEQIMWLRIARLYDFNLSLLLDLFVASTQKAPSDMAVSSVFGLTLSYGRFFRLLDS